MQIHQVQRTHKLKSHRQRGRGGKRGKTAGRGTKGQLARAGRKLRPELRDLIKKIPKRRGYRFQSIADKPTVINLDALNKHFAPGAAITPAILLEKKIIRRSGSGVSRVKILATGKIDHALNISGCTISAAARAKVEAAGGTVK